MEPILNKVIEDLPLDLRKELEIFNKKIQNKKRLQIKMAKKKKSSEEIPGSSDSKKAIVFDASTLISLSMNGLYPELEELKRVFDGKFFITKDIWHEIIEKPLDIKKFALEALKAKSLLGEGVLEMPDSVGMSDKDFKKKTKSLLKKANNIYKQSDGKSVEIIHSGEASAVALVKELEKKNYDCLLAVDERTTRMLIEKPKKLIKYLKKKLHTNLKLDKKNFEPFKGVKVIRSCEIIYLAYKKGLVRLRDGDNILDALLYAVKTKGCAISSDEIKKIKRLYKEKKNEK